MHLARIHRGKETISALQHVACRLSASAGRQVESPGSGGLSCRRHLVRHRDHLGVVVGQLAQVVVMEIDRSAAARGENIDGIGEASEESVWLEMGLGRVSFAPRS
jgi:hypothetical protein